MSRHVVLLLAAVAVLAAGCGKPVLDTKDLDRSIAKMRDSVDEPQQGTFDAAIALVREASGGKIAGTKPFSLDGMTLPQVMAESERIDIRRERALEEESVAAYQEVLAAEQRLAQLRVTDFVALSQDENRMEADVTVRNGLKLPVDTAWLRVEIGRPGGPSRSGDEFLYFRPPLRPGELRTVRMKVVGTEAAELPMEPPAQARYLFQLVESGGRVALQAPTPQERRKAQAAIAVSQQRVKELDAKLAAVQVPK